MMIVLIRHDPAKNINRWYVVGIQPTLFCQHAVLCGWGRRGTAYARWRILPAEDRSQASKMANAILAAKIKKGYQIIGDQTEKYKPQIVCPVYPISNPLAGDQLEYFLCSYEDCCKGREKEVIGIGLDCATLLA